MKKNKEYQIQVDFVNYLKLKYPDMLFTISPAGFIMSAGMAMKMIRMGYRKGTLDVLIFEPSVMWHGLFIEFKVKGGVVKVDQSDFILKATNKGYCCRVCWSTEEGIEALENYLALC